MYIRRKVFSLLKDEETGEERYFSTTDIEQREFGWKSKLGEGLKKVSGAMEKASQKLKDSKAPEIKETIGRVEKKINRKLRDRKINEYFTKPAEGKSFKDINHKINVKGIEEGWRGYEKSVGDIWNKNNNRGMKKEPAFSLRNRNDLYTITSKNGKEILILGKLN